MATRTPDTEELLRRAGAGDASARQQLLARHRDRLRRMVAVRLDPRLAARVALLRPPLKVPRERGTRGVRTDAAGAPLVRPDLLQSSAREAGRARGGTLHPPPAPPIRSVEDRRRAGRPAYDHGPARGLLAVSGLDQAVLISSYEGLLLRTPITFRKAAIPRWLGGAAGGTIAR
jgi:hypothetical protein